MKVIINADDFGLSESINKGIVDAFKQGLVSSATIMVNGAFAGQAYDLAKEYNTPVGVHLNLTHGKSILPPNQVQSLVDDRGNFHYVCMLGVFTQYLDAKKELKAQVEEFLSHNITPTHLDYHHYFHEIPNIYKAYLEIAKEYNLPVRSWGGRFTQQAKDFGLKTTDAFSFDFHGNGVNLNELFNIKKAYANFDTVEILTHIGYIDEYTTFQTNYLIRDLEIKCLQEAKEKDWYNDITLINFSDL